LYHDGRAKSYLRALFPTLGVGFFGAVCDAVLEVVGMVSGGRDSCLGWEFSIRLAGGLQGTGFPLTTGGNDDEGTGGYDDEGTGGYDDEGIDGYDGTGRAICDEPERLLFSTLWSMVRLSHFCRDGIHIPYPPKREDFHGCDSMSEV